MIKVPSIKLPATMDNLDQMLEFVLSGVTDFKITHNKSVLKKIKLICEEMLVNIINYGYPEETGKIEIIYKTVVEEEKVVIKIIDNGIPFNPIQHKKPNLSASIEERDIGGLGIHIAKKISDHMNYKRSQGQNILILVKFIN